MPKKVLPINPPGVARQKLKNIPSVVIKVFNELIAKEFSGGSARVLQEDVVKKLVERGFKRGDIFDNGWLDIEDIFRKNGWTVEYDKPGYCESYEPYFLFSARQ